MQESGWSVVCQRKQERNLVCVLDALPKFDRFMCTSACILDLSVHELTATLGLLKAYERSPYVGLGICIFPCASIWDPQCLPPLLMSFTLCRFIVGKVHKALRIAYTISMHFDFCSFPFLYAQDLIWTRPPQNSDLVCVSNSRVGPLHWQGFVCFLIFFKSVSVFPRYSCRNIEQGLSIVLFF